MLKTNNYKLAGLLVCSLSLCLLSSCASNNDNYDSIVLTKYNGVQWSDGIKSDLKYVLDKKIGEYWNLIEISNNYKHLKIHFYDGYEIIKYDADIKEVISLADKIWRDDNYDPTQPQANPSYSLFCASIHKEYAHRIIDNTNDNIEDYHKLFNAIRKLAKKHGEVIELD